MTFASQSPQRLSCNWPAWLALLAMTFWPALASANCCCKRASLIESLQSSPIASCCQTSSKSCCCESGQNLGSQNLGSQNLSGQCSIGDTAADGCDRTTAKSKGCQCSFDCCKAIPLRLRSIIAPDHSNAALIANVAVSFDSPFRIASLDVVASQRCSFLSSQDHCAEVCCWLK